MSGLAELLVRRGCRVSGSDLAAGPITRRLEGLGLKFFQGHRAGNLDSADVVVHTTAVKEDNPELAAAKARGLTVLRRGQMLAKLMEGHQQIAITGAHGKTSTTAMTAAILRAGSLDPTVVVGAVWDHLGSNAVLGRGKYFVAESDESDGSFTYLRPQITVVTNLDREHLDFYRDLAHIQETFAAYFRRLPAGAQVCAWADDPHLKPVLRHHSGELVTYSFKNGADFRAYDPEPLGLGHRFNLSHRGRKLGQVTVPLAGSHYVLNAMAACAVGHILGLDFPVWQAGLKSLGQIHRRCQVKGESRGITVLDDYGHHPTEIASTLKGLSQAFPKRRLVVAFQPHRYSRTAALLPEFFPVFAKAGLVFITEIYAASEKPLKGVSGRAICEGIRKSGHPAAHFVEEKNALTDTLMEHLREGDLLLTLGAGDIWKIGEELLARLDGKACSSREAP
ncbi:MAG: UDP-N-acetylmuramate--L-alanine ligase [Deltaproteobacteria bacterium]|nr:UDP-N-acetylmuramate--L-alanine ligase [Deltaproteobacteria bacterium]